MTNDKLLSQSINFLRFPLIIGILYVHFYLAKTGLSIHGVKYGADAPDWFFYLNVFCSGILSAVSVPMFFWFSGLLFFYKTEFCLEAYKKKLRRRVRTLLVPYILWNLIAILWTAKIFVPGLSSLFSNADGVKLNLTIWGFINCFYDNSRGLFLAPEVNLVNPAIPINGPLWYIRDLMVLVLISPVLYWLIKKLRVWLLLVMAVFYLFIPFLNILVRHMGEKAHVRFLALLSFAYIFLGTVPGFSVTMNNSVWFIVLYFISSYIRLYPKEMFRNRRFWGIASLACIFACALSVVLCTLFGVKTGAGIAHSWHFVMDSNRLPAVLTALSTFMYFNNLKIPQSRLINTIASTTFGVLLIHANGAETARWLWIDLLHTVESHATSFGYLHALLCVPLVFAAASCIDLLRIRFIERPFFKVLDRKLPGITAGWKRLEERFFKKCHIS